MDVEEHFYADDPASGPVDAKTNLPGVDYYFLGNGLIQAAVQVCRNSGATPAGLLLMDPGRLGPKRAALSFDPSSGLEPTLVSLVSGGEAFRAGPAAPRSRWIPESPIPIVEVSWRGGPFAVREFFACPDSRSPRLIRRVLVTHLEASRRKAVVRTGIRSQAVDRELRFNGREAKGAVLEYRIDKRRRRASVRFLEGEGPWIESGAAAHWAQAARLRSDPPLYDGLFAAAVNQLPAAVSRGGRLDGSIWQYNLEWVRDQAFAAMALVMSGDFELARTILARLLREFTSGEGAALDSSRQRADEDYELDQNGILLLALEAYADWTGDAGLLREFRAKILKAVEYPLRTAFLHQPSGLLWNRREFWERHAAFGIGDGMELAHELFVSMGLLSAARLAARLGVPRRARSWSEASRRIRAAMLEDPKFGLIENGRLIKRRDIGGRLQATIRPLPGLGLPMTTPLFAKGAHFLNPDSSAALPIAWEFVDPRSRLARRTMDSLETLWNQGWKGGGYGRYHLTSEPDSPGPWPFPSLFLARAYFEAGQDEKVCRVLDWLAGMPGSRAGTWFEFYGSRPIPPCPQVGVTPWTWAELIFLFVRHLLGVRPAEKELLLRPRLLRGIKRVEASLRLRQGRLDLEIKKAGRGRRPGFSVGSVSHPWIEGRGLEIPFPRPGERIAVRGFLP